MNTGRIENSQVKLMNMNAENEEIKLPEEIEGYTFRCLGYNNFVVIEYSKEAAFLRYVNHLPDIHKNIPNNLLYEVKSSNEEDAYDQMYFRYTINDQIKENDFINCLIFKIDSTIKFRELKKGYDFLMRTFDCYLILDPMSLARYYAVVTTNLNQDLPMLPTLLTQLERGLFFNQAISNLPKKQIKLIKQAQFTRTTHLYTKKNIENEKPVIGQFGKNGWNVIIKDPKFLSKDGYLLPKKLENRLILCENKNDRILNSIGLANTKFLPSANSHSLFLEVKNQDIEGLRDRDFLSSSEVSRIKKRFTNYHVLEYYCIENYLYHPDNIDSLGKKEFDKQSYIAEIIEQKNQSVEITLKNLKKSRGYEELKFPGIANEKIAKNEIISSLKSEKFKRFYKFFDMKSFNKSIIEHLNLSPEELSNTDWFKENIVESIRER